MCCIERIRSIFCGKSSAEDNVNYTRGTIFGIRLLLIIAAVAESTEDVNQLMKGEAIPLYKMSNTWVFYYFNLGRIVEELVSTAMANSSVNLYKEMNKLTDFMTAEFEQELDK